MRRPIRFSPVRTGLCYSAVFIALFVSTAAPRAEIVDAIVATVDTEVILYSELLAEVRAELNDLRSRAASNADFERQAERVLQGALGQAIESKILFREGQLIGVEISDGQVEANVDALRKLYPSEEAFLAELAQAGETLSEFRERTYEQLVARRVYNSKLNLLEDEVVVSEADVAHYYDEHNEEFTHPEQVRVRQIFLRVPEGANSEEREKARARLDLLREELAAGADFGDLARLYSQAPGAEDGGIVGWQQRGDLVPVLEEVVFSLAPGEVTGVLETQGGVHLMKVDQRQEPGVAALEEVRSDIEPLLRTRAAEQRYRKWIAELRKRRGVRIYL